MRSDEAKPARKFLFDDSSGLGAALATPLYADRQSAERWESLAQTAKPIADEAESKRNRETE